MDPTTLTTYIAIPISFLLGGYQFAHSQNILPTLYSLPVFVSTPLFTQVYYSGFKIILPGAILTAATYGYAAYRTTPQTGGGLLSRRNLLVFGAMCAIGVGAWTKIVMGAGVERVIAISKDAAMQVKAEESGKVLRLLKAWTGQNDVRPGIWVGAGVAGLLAVME
ncbi:hypothetical protein CLAFUR0_07188 [Fulvia fulva]|nr:hypothetical protein CLAFUR0_07188 [Fulvia fulva]